MSNQWYLRNPLVHKNRRRSAGSDWVRTFDCTDMRPLIICRGPIRMEAMTVFETEAKEKGVGQTASDDGS